MFSAVKSWLGGTQPDYEVSPREVETGNSDQKEEPGTESENKDGSAPENKDESGTQVPNIGEVGEKTLTAAKEWGGESGVRMMSTEILQISNWEQRSR